MSVSATPERKHKSTGAAYLWWFFLGAAGAHRFYLGHKRTGMAMLLILIASVPLTFVMGIGSLGFIVVGIWALVDAFLIPKMLRDYNEGRTPISA